MRQNDVDIYLTGMLGLIAMINARPDSTDNGLDETYSAMKGCYDAHFHLRRCLSESKECTLLPFSFRIRESHSRFGGRDFSLFVQNEG